MKSGKLVRKLFLEHAQTAEMIVLLSVISLKSHIQQQECLTIGRNNGNTKKLRIRICVGYIERTSVGNTVRSSVCLHSAVLP
jgi:hypothetical protein